MDSLRIVLCDLHKVRTARDFDMGFYVRIRRLLFTLADIFNRPASQRSERMSVDEKTDPQPYWSEKNPEPFYAANEARWWHLYLTEPKKERSAEQLAKSCGLMAALPMETRAAKRRRSNTKRTVKAYPVITGYIFIACRSILDHMRAQEIDCIGPAVRCNGQYVVISSAEMGLVMAKNGHSIPHTQSVNMRKGVSAGDGVNVISGPFREREARIKSVDMEAGTIQLLFEVLGINCPITLPIDAVEPI